MSPRLKKLYDIWISLYHVEQEIGITHARKRRFLFFGCETRHVVGAVGINSEKVMFCFLTDRRFREKLLPVVGILTCRILGVGPKSFQRKLHKAIGLEGFFVKENSRFQSL